MSQLREAVRESLNRYFLSLEGEKPVNMYHLVLSEMEIPLLEIVMEQTKGNQCRAAQWLGISRGTLRKLLAKYHLD